MTWKDWLGAVVGKPPAVAGGPYPALADDLGLVTQNGFTVLLCCRTALPARFSEIFSTSEDGQAVLPVKVYRRVPATGQAEHLGTLVIDEITPAPAGTPEIHVAIVVDVSGVVMASSREAGSGRQKQATLGRVDVAPLDGDALGGPERNERI